MKHWLRNKLDWMSYWWFYRRWMRHDSDKGWLYMMSLYMQEHFQRHPLDERQKFACEEFAKAIIELRNKRRQEIGKGGV